MSGCSETSIDRGAFTVGKSDRAVLLIHGIAACPMQLRGLAERLAAEGIEARAMLLPGHGGNYKELYNVKWRDWHAVAERELKALRTGHSEVSVVGFSIGSALAIELAADGLADRAVLINTPLYYFYQFLPQRFLLSVLNLLTREIRTFAIGGSGRGLIYPRVPVKLLYTMGELVHRARERAREIRCPALVVHSTHDLASRAKSATHLMKKMATENKRLVWIRDRDHSLLQGEKKEKVLAEIVTFLTDKSAAGGRQKFVEGQR